MLGYTPYAAHCAAVHPSVWAGSGAVLTAHDGSAAGAATANPGPVPKIPPIRPTAGTNETANFALRRIVSPFQSATRCDRQERSLSRVPGATPTIPLIVLPLT